MLAGCAILHTSSVVSPEASSTTELPLAVPSATVSGVATSPRPTATSIQIAKSIPVSLVIPRLNVEASLDPINVGLDGFLNPPSDPTTVGWWNQEVKLGSPTGTVVLTGHTVHSGGGALNNVWQLHSNDLIIVIGANKQRYSYRVTSNPVKYSETAVPAEKAYRQIGSAQLTITTCDIQSYDVSTHTYADSTVVYAVPVH
jgi:hypothetical protein